ncbi:MAG: ABC transporter substrate-binding protein [Clostridia bacterium]|nr:ABC transporter substrate-binding protein [Clostridia bacterium]
MKNLKKGIALAMAASLSVCALAGCNTSSSGGSTANTGTGSTAASDSSASGGKVYYLNFKPEQADAWKALAKTYTEKTGVQVTVETAASGTYESKLKAEMAKENAPTLFQVNGPVELAAWTDYCYNLKETDLYSNLKSDDFALIDGDQVKGIAYVIETYGIIYNKTLLNDYIATDGAVVSSVDEINNFDTLKAVVEDIQAKKDDLGIQGAFTSSGMDSSSDWRFKTHLANLPIYYEYKADGIDATDAIKGTYLDNYRAIWDLYLNNATCEPKMISGKTGDDATSEFCLGEAVFYQNGTWAYQACIDAGMTDEDLGMLPIYIGAEGEEDQGLCTGSENYWCVNNKASEADIQATLEFLNWVITSDEGRDSLANEMGFVTPFTTFDDGYQADNALITAANEYIANGKTAVSWNFSTIPSEKWKDNLGSALLIYAQDGQTDDKWADVQKAFVDGWKTEYEAANTGVADDAAAATADNAEETAE